MIRLLRRMDAIECPSVTNHYSETNQMRENSNKRPEQDILLRLGRDNLCLGAILLLRLLVLNLQDISRLNLSKLAQRCTGCEQLVDLLETSTLELRNTKVCHNHHGSADTSIDETDLATKCRIGWLEEVRKGEGGDECRDDGDDASE